jgi:hypothetical protein
LRRLKDLSPTFERQPGERADENMDPSDAATRWRLRNFRAAAPLRITIVEACAADHLHGGLG